MVDLTPAAIPAAYQGFEFDVGGAFLAGQIDTQNMPFITIDNPLSVPLKVESIIIAPLTRRTIAVGNAFQINWSVVAMLNALSAPSPINVLMQRRARYYLGLSAQPTEQLYPSVGTLVQLGTAGLAFVTETVFNASVFAARAYSGNLAKGATLRNPCWTGVVLGEQGSNGVNPAIAQVALSYSHGLYNGVTFFNSIDGLIGIGDSIQYQRLPGFEAIRMDTGGSGIGQGSARLAAYLSYDDFI